jgi:hypothetical protein
VSCATLKGDGSYFDGCNTCSCSNGVAKCTKRACPPPTDATRCDAQCDGAETAANACGVCKCLNGKPVQCSKCSACRVDSLGQPTCDDATTAGAVLPEPDDNSGSAGAVIIVGSWLVAGVVALL